MVDLKNQYSHIQKEIDTAIKNVIDSTAFIKGFACNIFKDNLAEFLNVKHVILVGNGTDALKTTLLALDLKKDDEIITPSFTFVATAEVCASIGCKPVLVDVDPHSFCISLESIQKALTPKTKVIVPVHLFGQSAPMEDILNLASKNNIYVLEDACQAINADYFFRNGKSQKLGTLGIAGCTSFFPSKNLGCFGDGGAIFTNDDALASKMNSIANHGMSSTKYNYNCIGINSRLDSIQAAILDVKLKYLKDYTLKRQTAAAIYDDLLKENSKIDIPARMNYSSHVFNQYTLKIKNGKRDFLKDSLLKNNIPSMIYYPTPLHMQKPYYNFRSKTEPLTTSEILSKEVLSIPMHTELTIEQQQYICNNIINILEQD